MKTIVICGHPHSGFDAVYQHLAAAGLAPAQPSRREGMEVGRLHEKILQAHDISAETATTVEQLQPGKLWQELAIDLFLGNLEAPQWGWADARSTWLLDFWKEMDPQVRFILVYATPEHTVAHLLHAHGSNAEGVLQQLQAYHAYNASLLNFFMRNQSRCLLVDQCAALQQPGELLQHMEQQWGIKLPKALQAKAEVQTPLAEGAVAQLIAQQLLASTPQLQAMHEELQSVATFATVDGAKQKTANPADDAALLSNYLAMYQRTGERGGANARENPSTSPADTPTALAIDPTQYSELQKENELLLGQLHQVQEELEGQFLQHQETQQQLDAQIKTAQTLQAQLQQAQQAHAEQTKAGEALKTQLQQTQQQNTELQEENELLLLQLHQVQEELEHYFLKYQDGQQQLEAQTERIQQTEQQIAAEKQKQLTGYSLSHDYWLRHHPAEVLIDLREPIPGSNWYEPELDGTWAGPELLSTIQMPALRAGKYDVLIDVVDAMDASLIEGLQATLAGVPLELRKEIHDKAALVRARLDSSQLPRLNEWTLALQSPATISPAQRGEADSRQLSVRIKTIKFKAIN